MTCERQPITYIHLRQSFSGNNTPKNSIHLRHGHSVHKDAMIDRTCLSQDMPGLNHCRLPQRSFILLSFQRHNCLIPAEKQMKKHEKDQHSECVSLHAPVKSHPYPLKSLEAPSIPYPPCSRFPSDSTHQGTIAEQAHGSRLWRRCSANDSRTCPNELES